MPFQRKLRIVMCLIRAGMRWWWKYKYQGINRTRKIKNKFSIFMIPTECVQNNFKTFKYITQRLHMHCTSYDDDEPSKYAFSMYSIAFLIHFHCFFCFILLAFQFVVYDYIWLQLLFITIDSIDCVDKRSFYLHLTES